MKVGDTATIPDAVCSVKTSGTWSYLGYVPTDISVTAAVGQTDAAVQTGNTVKAVAAGTFDIVYSNEYASKTVTVTVKENKSTIMSAMPTWRSGILNIGGFSIGTNVNVCPGGLTGINACTLLTHLLFYIKI